MAYAKLTSRIPAIIAAIDPAVDATLKVSAESVVADAKSRVPRDTDRLYNAIHAEDVPAGQVVMAGDEDAWYGHLVENGTSGPTGHPPRPFLAPALEGRREGVIAAVAAALKAIT